MTKYTPQNDSPEITLWCDPKLMFVSSYGVVTYREWLKRERDRLEKAGRKTYIIRRPGGTICLSYVTQDAFNRLQDYRKRNATPSKN